MLPFLSLSLLASAAAAPAYSHPHEHEPVALDHMVVTAQPYARAQTDVAQPTTVLAGRALDLRQAPTLGDLLGHEPGISSTYFGPGAGRPIIRGLGGDRLRILQNGVGTFDASVTSPDHAVALDPLLIERVEVVRGPAALLYGSSAVGGVVNVVSHRIHRTAPEQPLVGRFEVRLGSVNEERSAGAVLEGGAGAFAWHLDGFRRETRDVRIPGFAWSEARRAGEDDEHEEEHPEDEGDVPAYGRIPNTAIVSDGGAAGLSWIGSRGYVGIAFSGLNTFYGIPPGSHVHEEHDEEESEEEEEEEHGEEDVRIDLRQRRVDVEGEWSVDAGLLQSIRFKLGRAEYRHQELEGETVGTVFTNRGHEARLELLHHPLGGFSGAAGAQWNQQRLEAEGDEAFLPPGRTDQQALFLLEEIQTGAWTWQFGGRAERQKITLRDGSSRRRSDQNFSLAGGVVWALDESWSLAASAAHTRRPPNAQELYSDGPHIGTLAYEVGDDTLSRETSNSLDFSLRRRSGRTTGSLTLFTHRFDGFVFAAPTAEEEEGLTVYRYVQRDARFEGAELETVFHLHEDDEGLLDLTLGADLVRARERTTRTDLPRITPPRLRLGVDWRQGAWSAGAEWQRVARQTHVAPYETESDGYSLASAYVGWRLLAGRATVDVLLRGTNLTNREARLHTSYLKEIAPLPGRGGTLAVRVSF